ncbi:MAG: ribosome-associated translation inhibitor RaiA [Bacilli bacterium]|nr:ribosome-associated translation inhibitor RaiA [Bacilli bacterium]
MKIEIHGDKVKLTPAIKSYIEEKVSKLNKYFESPEKIEVKVIIRIKSNMQIIEVTVPIQKFTLRAEESHSDLYAAIDLVVDKLENQFRKHKTRLNDKYKKDPKIIDFIFDLDEDVKENKNKIIRRKRIESKPMDEEEAILQMELLNHDFFIFDNIDEDCFSVIYRRKDGQYGIINTN